MINMQIIGYLGQDATSSVVNGKSVINFGVAHTETFMRGDQKVQNTIWVDCAYWTDRTGLLPYLKKGTQVHVDGNPHLKTFTKRDGTQGTALALRVRSIQLLSQKPDAAPGQPQSSQGQQEYRNAEDITEPIDDLPF